MPDDLLRGLAEILCTDKITLFLLDEEGKKLSCAGSVSGWVPDEDRWEEDLLDFVRNTNRRVGADALRAWAGPLVETLGDHSRLDYIPILDLNRPVGALVVADCPDAISDRVFDLISLFLGRFGGHLRSSVPSKTLHPAPSDKDSAQALRTRTMYMVHQLKSPLAAIQQLLSVLAEGIVGELNEKQSELVQRAQSRVRTQLEVLGDWLMGEYATLGLAEERVRPVKVRAVFEQALEKLRPQVEMRHVRVMKDELEPNGTVPGDPELLTSAFRLVLAGAVKSSPDGGSVALVSQREGKGIRIFVRDQGPGVESKDVPSLFEDSFRLKDQGLQDKTSPRELSLCKKILEAHGGWIKVRNRPEGGFETEMFLPVG